MGNRLSKIVTRTGDGGMTGLGDGSRTSKASLRIEAIGAVDELNCVIGQAISLLSTGPNRTFLKSIQHRLFDLGGELSVPKSAIIDKSDVDTLEAEIVQLNDKLPYLKDFIVPGGSLAVSTIHLARAIARRAERSIFTLHEVEPVRDEPKQFLNRLSDYLFVLARTEADGNDVLWEPKTRIQEVK